MDLVTISEVAKKLGIDRSNARKFVLKNGFETIKTKTVESGNQSVICVTREDFEKVVSLRQQLGFVVENEPNGKVQTIVDTESGLFYFVKLVPELSTNRVKIGFTNDIKSRISAHRTSAPTAEVIRTWECKRSWESCAIQCATREANVQIGQEVYEFNQPDKVIERLDMFFDLLK